MTLKSDYVGYFGDADVWRFELFVYDDDGGAIVTTTMAVTDEMRLAKSLSDRVFAFDPSGGSLHIAIQDYNLTDDDLSFCQKCITMSGASDEQKRAEEECLATLLELSYNERTVAIGGSPV